MERRMVFCFLHSIAIVISSPGSGREGEGPGRRCYLAGSVVIWCLWGPLGNPCWESDYISQMQAVPPPSDCFQQSQASCNAPVSWVTLPARQSLEAGSDLQNDSLPGIYIWSLPPAPPPSPPERALGPVDGGATCSQDSLHFFALPPGGAPHSRPLLQLSEWVWSPSLPSLTTRASWQVPKVFSQRHPPKRPSLSSLLNPRNEFPAFSFVACWWRMAWCWQVHQCLPVLTKRQDRQVSRSLSWGNSMTYSLE